MAEVITQGKASRDRKLNFSAAESLLISERVTEKLEFLRGRFSNEMTNAKKQEIWKEVTEEVNALGVCKRTEEEVRNKWRNMTRGAKEKFTRERSERMKTGGGPPPPRLSLAEENVINALKETATFRGIDGGLETIIGNEDQPTTLSLTEEIWRNRLEVHHSRIGEASVPLEIPRTQDAEIEEACTDPILTSAQSNKRSDVVPPPSKKRKTAEDVYALQCAVLEKELIKNNLQIQLLQRILDNSNSFEDINSFALFSALH